MNDEIFIVLPSNVKPTGNTINLVSEFRTPLPNALELDKSSWFVALTEISYPHSWKRIFTGNQCDYKVAIADLQNETSEIKYPCSEKIKKKDFSTIMSLLESLNKYKPKGFQGSFSKDDNEHIVISLKEGEAIQMKKSLSDVLGFYQEKYFHTAGIMDKNDFYHITSEMKPDFDLNTHNIFVYSNLVNPYLVGDTEVPLLRNVPVKKHNYNEYVSKSFEIPYYLPISANFFQYIDIKITDDLGENIKFEWGKVIVHLHLKKKVNSTL